MSTDQTPLTSDQPASAEVGTVADSQPSQQPAAEGATSTPAEPLSSDLFDASLQAVIASGDKTMQDTARAMNRAFTQKTQALAAERKELDALRAFGDAYKADPARAVKLLAQQHGLEFRDPAPPTPPADVINDTLVNGLRQALGPEWGDLAERIGPALAPLTQQIAQQAVADALKPIQTKQEALIQDSAQREMQAQLSAFEKKHPDYKQHEAAMTALSQKFIPGEGVNEQEYLEQLYFLASRDAQIASAVEAQIKRINASASAAEKPAGSVAASKVVTRPSGPITIAEAYAAAKRGETLA